ncbi:MAG TPA: hypothetical protein VN883_03305 [Myxococcales bacterium]|jgi:hypothetical protein|nr:hypothetical protein [Myxococcales bacterium]
MLFRKLFRLLVLGGAVVGTTSGCARPGQGQQAAEEKPDGGSAPDGGTTNAQGTGGAATPDAGGGVSGW